MGYDLSKVRLKSKYADVLYTPEDEKKIQESAFLEALGKILSPQEIRGATTQYSPDELPEKYYPSNYNGGNVIYEVSPQSYADPFFEGSQNKIYTNIPSKIKDDDIERAWATPTETIIPDLSDPNVLRDISAFIAKSGKSPSKYGFPTFNELKKEIPKIQIKEIPNILMSNGLEYDENLSEIENWNRIIKQSNPELKNKLINDLKSSTAKKESGQYAEAKDRTLIDQRINKMVGDAIVRKYGKDAVTWDPLMQTWQFTYQNRPEIMQYADKVKGELEQKYYGKSKEAKDMPIEQSKSYNPILQPAIDYLQNAKDRDDRIRRIRDLHFKGWTKEQLEDIARILGWE